MRSLSLSSWIIRQPRFQRWLQGRGPLTPPFTIAYRQVYILPTRFGITFGLLLTAMLLGALNYNNNAALLLAFLLATAAQLSTFRTWKNLSGLDVGTVHVQPVFASEPAEFRLNLYERQGFERPILELDEGMGISSRIIDSKNPPEATRLTLQAEHSGMLEVIIPTQQRGWLECPRLRLSTIYPLGLFRAWSWIHPDQRCLVYPQRLDNAPPLPAPASGDGRRNLQAEPDADFAGLRDYRPGDHLKDVAWKATARMGKMISREEPPSAFTELLFKLSQTGTTDMEQSLRILTTWVVIAEQRGLQYGLSLPGVLIEPHKGARHQHQCLRTLALWQNADPVEPSPVEYRHEPN